MKPPPRKHARPKPLRPRKLEQQGTHSREGGCAVVRPGYRLVIVLAVLFEGDLVQMNFRLCLF
jgi:hypothetical protein